VWLKISFIERFLYYSSFFTAFANSFQQEHEMLVRVQASQYAIPALQDVGFYIYAIEDGFISAVR